MNVAGQLEIVAHSTVCVMDLVHPGPTTVHVTRDLSWILRKTTASVSLLVSMITLLHVHYSTDYLLNVASSCVKIMLGELIGSSLNTTYNYHQRALIETSVNWQNVASVHRQYYSQAVASSSWGLCQRTCYGHLSIHLSVRPSVPSGSSIKTAKLIIMQTTPHKRQLREYSFLRPWGQRSWWYFSHLLRRRQMQMMSKNCVFDQSQMRYRR